MAKYMKYPTMPIDVVSWNVKENCKSIYVVSINVVTGLLSLLLCQLDVPAWLKPIVRQAGMASQVSYF